MDHAGEEAVSAINRINCPTCDASCIEQETICWQCGKPLSAPPPGPALPEASPAEGVQAPGAGFIQFGEGTSEESEAHRRRATLLTQETVKISEAAASDRQPEAAATIGDITISAGPKIHLMRLTFCKGCGQQNDEEAVECRKCGAPLEVIEADRVPDIVPVPRTVAFDVLGGVWCALGLAAIYCGQFLVKADPQHPGTTWADYFWTGMVACAPGILIFMRHYFCKFLFWVMTLVSLLVWSVLGFFWLFIGLHISENGKVGLTWLALLSGLSVFSYYVVRQNDEFDFGS